MDEVHVVRHKHFNEKQSIRRIAREMGIHRATVRKYLAQAEPCRVERGFRARPVTGSVGCAIESVLEEWAPRLGGKHRLTSVRLHRELVARGVGVSERTVRRYLAERRRAAAEVYVPLVHRPGDEAQVDFFEVAVVLKGVMRKAWKFLMRLMYSKRDWVWLYDRCDQVSFLDAHVRAFEALGAVPHRLVYDNLPAAVKRRVMGMERELSGRFRALSSHYLFEPCFARPGEGHDKGGVENRGKGIRLQHLTPIVAGESLGAIATALQEDLDRVWGVTPSPEGPLLGTLYDQDQFLMKPLPAVPFDPRLVQPVVVSRSATVTVRGASYSTPTTWARLDALASIGVEDVVLTCRGEEHRHPLQPRGGRSIRYRHYLPELARKPQALRQVAPELLAELGEPYQRLWSLLEATHGPMKAARLLAGVLGALNEHGEALVSQAVLDTLEKAGSGHVVGAGSVLIALAHRLPMRPVLESRLVPPALRCHEIPSGRAADYDVLLSGGGR
jgi:transposase